MGTIAKEMIDHLASDKEGLVNAAINAGKNPLLWISVAQYLYTKMTEETPLEDECLAKYRTMCILYVKLYPKSLQTVKIPSEWALNDQNQPIYRSDFAAMQEKLHHELESFDECHHGLKTQINGIVSNISRLFVSLSKRRNVPLRERYRPDGFESMFYNEMAMWLVIDLPRYSITDKETADIVQRRIDYCTSMFQLLVYRGDTDIANPKNVLPAITTELKVMHQYLSQAHRAATFTEKATSIDRRLLDMVSSTFNILHLMLKDVDQQVFQVEGFLSPGEGRKKKNDLLKKTVLGQWLVQTCESAGIIANDYTSRKEISYELIASHISTDLSTLKSIDQIGMCDFVWKTDYRLLAFWATFSKQAETYLSTKGPAFLSLIRDLHRSILRLSYIRKGLATGMQLNIAYGQTWFFAKAEGRAMFEGLMDALTDAIDVHSNTADQFWNEFYTNTFEPFSLSHHIDSRDQIHTDMMASLKFYQKTVKSKSDIVTLVKATQHHADQFQGTDEVNKEKQQMLTKQLYTYLSKVPKYDTVKLAALRALIETKPHAVSQPRPPALGVPVVSPAETKNAASPLSKETTEESKFKAPFLANARELLVREGGYSPEHVPTNLINDIYQFNIYMLTPDQEYRETDRRLEKYDAAIAAAKAHKQTQIRGARIRDVQLLARETLKEFGDEIPAKLLNDTFNFLILTTETPAVEYDLAKEKYDAAIAAANAHKQTQTKGTGMPNTKTSAKTETGTSSSENLIYSKKSLATYYSLKAEFDKPIKDYCSVFSPLSGLTPSVSKLQGPHRAIYDNILAPYSANAEGSFFTYFWKSEKFDMLRKHHSRMTNALLLIAQDLELHTPDYKFHLDLVNQLLCQGLGKMSEDMPWMDMRNSAALIMKMTPSALDQLIAVPKTQPGDEERVRVISPKVVVDLAKAETAKSREIADNALTAAASDRALLSKFIEEATKDRADAAKDRADAAKDRAELTGVIQTLQVQINNLQQEKDAAKVIPTPQVQVRDLHTATLTSSSTPGTLGIFPPGGAKVKSQESLSEAKSSAKFN